MPATRRFCQTLSAFTLIELLTVIAVLAILSALTLGAVRGARERSRITRARAELAALSTALEEFRRLHGDYPQTGEFAQAPATPTDLEDGPGIHTAQAKLFNCLTGVFGPRAFRDADRLNGPDLLDAGRFTINGTLTNDFLAADLSRGIAAKPEQDACLLDPWGRRYVYYYKNPRAPAAWEHSGYVLYSAGARVTATGADTPPVASATGLMLPTQTAEMADNIYANR